MRKKVKKRLTVHRQYDILIFRKEEKNMGKKKRKRIKKISLKDVSSWLELVIKLITIAILLKQLIG